MPLAWTRKKENTHNLSGEMLKLLEIILIEYSFIIFCLNKARVLFSEYTLNGFNT